MECLGIKSCLSFYTKFVLNSGLLMSWNSWIFLNDISFFLFDEFTSRSNLEIYKILTRCPTENIIKNKENTYFRGELYWVEGRNEMSWSMLKWIYFFIIWWIKLKSGAKLMWIPAKLVKRTKYYFCNWVLQIVFEHLIQCIQ